MLKEGRSSKVFGSLFRSAAEILGHGAVPPGETLIFHIKSSALSIMRARCSGASILQKISGGNILIVVLSLVTQPVESIIEIFRTLLRNRACQRKEAARHLKSSSPTFLLLTQSRAASIWLARWSVFWPPFMGKIESNARKSPCLCSASN